ncbi:TonB-dependent receptor [uncultured Draconibacterium sp.]|uniref:SusC/RagA family TonB-linked outer membrane protein n=1 Tax=uncultured Draconibacterium sp. TaxID=1573823 RepID=UPI0029C7CD3A|nr:TonB-dependent receptor [uncultured Draconibacterium sp.]
MKKTFLMLLLFLISVCGWAQVQKISGTVVDEEKKPIPGVTVLVEGTTNGTLTDMDGKFQLSVNNSEALVRFSFIGMKTLVVPVNGKSVIDVTLKQDVLGLEEVVVVGYGQQEKASVVAAISSIGADEIVRTPTSNLATGLAGKMPGLTVMLKGGELGNEDINMYIRGQATTNNTQPLVLVDGIERELTTVDAYDVESVNVLKDASATAVYGVRGANGVILVTTKKGQVGKPIVTANANYSMQYVERLPQPLNAVDYMTVRNSAIEMHNQATGGNSPLAFEQELVDNYTDYMARFPTYYVDRDFYGEYMKDYTPMLKSSVNMRGGTKKTKYFASMGYTGQTGPFKTEGWDEYNFKNSQRLDRFNYRANVDLQINDLLKVYLNLSGYLQDKHDPTVNGSSSGSINTYGANYSTLMAQFTDIPSISFADVNEYDQVLSAPGRKDRVPFGSLNRTGYRTATTNTLQTTVGLNMDLPFITKGLSARAQVSYDSRATHIRGYRRTYATYIAVLNEVDGEQVVEYVSNNGDPDSDLSSALTQSFSTNFDLEGALNYARKFEQHNVTGMLLYKQSQSVNNIDIPRNYVGIVGRLTYSYARKYMTEFNFGMNGSEQFAPGKRFGFFPSVSLGWTLTEEEFMSNVGFLDYLKIRTSFGQVGNDRMGGQRFLYLPNWTQAQNGYFSGMWRPNGMPSATFESTMPNMNITWEVANKYNAAIETRVFDYIKLDVDVFYEKRSSILTGVSLIPEYMYGQSNLPPTNAGVMSNKGFEVTLGYSKSFKNDLWINTRFSATFARNKIVKMNETPLDDSYAYPYTTEGFSRGVMWGYDCLGYFESTEEIQNWADMSALSTNVLPGDLKYRDVNGDGYIDSKDLIPMEYPNIPEWNYSYTFSAGYKNFDFSVLIDVATNYMYNFYGRGVLDWENQEIGSYKNYFELHKYAWTPERYENGERIEYPRLHHDGITISKNPSSYWMKEMWFARLRNIEFGYSIPERACNSMKISKARVFVNGQNIFTLDNMPFKYFDPEVTNSLAHPVLSTVNVGLNVTF